MKSIIFFDGPRKKKLGIGNFSHSYERVISTGRLQTLDEPS
jgi:hypothetical protein